MSGTTGWPVDEVSVYGLRIQHTFENGVRLVTATAFDGAVGADVYLGKDLSASMGVVYRLGEYEDPKLELALGWKLRW